MRGARGSAGEDARSRARAQWAPPVEGAGGVRHGAGHRLGKNGGFKAREAHVLLEKRLGLERALLGLREEGHGDAAVLRRVALQEALLLEQLPGHGRQHAGAVTRDAVATAAAAVLHAAQRMECARHHIVRAASLTIDEEPDATRVALADQRHGPGLRGAKLAEARGHCRICVWHSGHVDAQWGNRRVRAHDRTPGPDTRIPAAGRERQGRRRRQRDQHVAASQRSQCQSSERGPAKVAEVDEMLISLAQPGKIAL